MSNFPVIVSILSEKKLGEFVKDKYNLDEGHLQKMYDFPEGSA